MKLILVILGFLIWRELLVLLVGEEATMGCFLAQAIYCRIRYWRDDVVFGTPSSPIPITAEVVEWNSTNTIH